MPSDLPREIVDALALVLPLAALTEDRTPREQKALDLLAAKVDRTRNKQSISNPGLPRGVVVGAPKPACTHSDDHPKSCPCRGDGRAWEPVGGWSRLADEVAP